MKKNRFFLFYVVLLIPLLLAVLLVVVTDPFFHYHAPIKGYPYILSEERYQNIGIVKHFKYDAMITGASTTQNFKASDVDRLFGKTTVKVSFAGASLKETGDIVKNALSSNKKLNLVIRGLDSNWLNANANEMAYADYPEYLYDRNPFNDYDYIFNIDVIAMIGHSLGRLFRQKPATSFDEYSAFSQWHQFGKEAVLSSFDRIPEGDYPVENLDDEDYKTIRDNIEQNVVNIAKQYPDVLFYVFIPPVSVCVWDAVTRTGQYEETLELMRYSYECMLEAENIRVFGFDDIPEITCNLDNYMDTLHYSDEINTFILESMAADEHRITKENYEEYINRIRDMYKDYDFDSIFE